MSAIIARVVYMVAMFLVSPEALARIHSLGYEVQELGNFYVIGYLWPEGHFCPAIPNKPLFIAPGGEFKIELTLPSGEKRRSAKLSYEGKQYSLIEQKPAYERGFVSTLPILFSIKVSDIVKYSSPRLTESLREISQANPQDLESQQTLTRLGDDAA